ncbi:MAG: hypothetical protein HY372_02150, partial [Candidatus Andersenbacteria bacterium]|nr:hypothetical protein [Candidatus Andersenbacteria bacterium]
LAYPIASQAFVLPEATNLLPAAPWPLAYTRETHTVTINGVGYDRSIAAARQGYGTLSYCSVLSPPTAVVPLTDPKSEYVRIEDGRGTAALLDWTPNWIVVQASIQETAHVVLNMNYADGWKASGRQVQSVGGRAGVLLPPGEHVVTWRYHAPGFGVGVWLTMVTVGLAVRSYHRARSVARP